MNDVTIEPVIHHPPDDRQAYVHEIFEYVVENGPCSAGQIAEAIDRDFDEDDVADVLEGLRYDGYIVLTGEDFSLTGNPMQTDYRTWEAAEPNHIIRAFRVKG